MESFKNKIAVVTGGGAGMGRELVSQLAREGCEVAMCDVMEENMQETLSLISSESPESSSPSSSASGDERSASEMCPLLPEPPSMEISVSKPTPAESRSRTVVAPVTM